MTLEELANDLREVAAYLVVKTKAKDLEEAKVSSLLKAAHFFDEIHCAVSNMPPISEGFDEYLKEEIAKNKPELDKLVNQE